MAERPLLLLPEATVATRGNKGGGGGGPAKLGAGRQQERLGPRLQELERAFESKRVQLQTATTGVVPEDVLVIETAGTVEEFVNPVDLFCLEVATATAEDMAEDMRLAWSDRLAADTTQDKGWTRCGRPAQ